MTESSGGTSSVVTIQIGTLPNLGAKLPALIRISGRIGLLKSMAVSDTRPAPGLTWMVSLIHTHLFGSSAGLVTWPVRLSAVGWMWQNAGSSALFASPLHWTSS